MGTRVVIKRLSLLAGLVAVLSLVCLGGTAHAVSLWYDGFDLGEYTADGALAGASGGNSGTFFTNPWISSGYPDPPAENTIVLSTGLTRPGLVNPAIGGAAGRALRAGCCQEQRVSRLLTDPWSGFTPPEGTFYLSFLANYGAGISTDVHHRTFEMHDAGFGDDPNRTLMLGFMGFAAGNIYQNVTLAVRDDNTATTTFVPLTVGGNEVSLGDMAVQGTHLLVLKFELSNSGDDVISAFLDPVGTTEPAPNAQITVGNMIADRMSAMAQFAYHGEDTPGALDEIRVGTEFSDVANNTLRYVGIPEPGTLSLVGLAAMACLLSARRKRA